ncbi:hypothetical protein COCNU_06G018240 [Cocos nucifera]|uniref:Uncharacterized protein n=1 Tax=Cocos nucifera TaxID=13894 RepID=A0A8K0N3W2_COCNU|nr:hypothetical protein COCNU_06G018240 [Cocos nucifera]
MDTKAVEMLAKRLQDHKRKEKAPGEGSKKARVDIPSSMASVNVTIAPKVVDGIEVVLTVEVGVTDGAAVPPTSSSPSTEVQVLELPVGGEKREKEGENEVGHLKSSIACPHQNDESLKKEEQTLVGLKAALALEEERRKKVEADITELKEQVSRQISEAKVQAVEEFKFSSEMRDSNVKFNQEAFIKGFKLCEDRMANKFLELDLSFLIEGASDEEAGPSTTVADLPLAEPTIEEPGPIDVHRTPRLLP